MQATYAAGPEMAGTGLLIARLVVGLLMASHGSQKLLGWFRGHGLQKTGDMFDHLGFHPGRLFATTASVTEVLSGLLLALGFLGPVGPALMISVMIVAALTVHVGNGLLSTSNGVEVPLLYAGSALALALTGPGPYSVDALLGLTPVWTPRVDWLVLAIGVVGGVMNLVLRRRPVLARSA